MKMKMRWLIVPESESGQDRVLKLVIGISAD